MRLSDYMCYTSYLIPRLLDEKDKDGDAMGVNSHVIISVTFEMG